MMEAGEQAGEGGARTLSDRRIARWGEPKHGTLSAYRHRGCRCAACRGANAAAMRAYRARRREREDGFGPRSNPFQRRAEPERARGSGAPAATLVAGIVLAGIGWVVWAMRRWR